MDPHVLYILGRYPVWSETFLRQDLGLLLEHGARLHPVALFRGDTEPRSDWPHVEILNDVPPAAPAAVSVRGRHPRLRTRLALFRHRRLLGRITSIAADLPAKHIHAEFGDLPGLVAGAAARRLGISYSIGVHANDVWLAKFSDHVLYDGAAFITVCNRAAREELLRRVPTLADRTHLIPHGIDLRRWRFRPPSEDREEVLRLLFVGRFVAKKGIPTLLHAVHLLNREGTAVRLTAIGDGSLRDNLRRLAAELSIDTLVAWRGVVPHESVMEELGRQDLLVVPSETDSQGDRDGTPNVVIEAMARGLPVAGTETGGLPEVLDENTGWVFPAGDAGQLAALLERMRSAGDETGRRCRQARKRIEKDFDAVQLAGKKSSLFSEALAA